MRDPSSSGGTPKDERHFQGLSRVKPMYERRGTSPPSAPVTIFPFGSQAITDVLLGLVEYSVNVRAEVIEAAFATRDIIARGADARRRSRSRSRTSHGKARRHGRDPCPSTSAGRCSRKR